MVRTDPGQEPAGPMAITLGYQVKSVERHRFHMRVISVLRDCAVLASLKTRSLLRFNHHQVSSASQRRANFASGGLRLLQLVLPNTQHLPTSFSEFVANRAISTGMAR